MYTRTEKVNKMGLGDIIKRRRLELGMTQNELADEICTQALISRIENNDLVPKKDILDRIEERLEFNISELNIVISMNTNQHKINELISEIRDYLDRRDYHSIELLIKYNESLIKSCKDIEDISFFKWMTATYLHQVDGNTEEAINILKEIPLDELDNEMSIEILNAIGLIYYQEKEFDDALSYFYSGMQKLNKNIDYKVQVKLLFNYALTLEESNQDNEALSVVLSGIDLLLEKDSIYILGDFYYTKGFIFNKLNNYSEALDNFELALALFRIQNNNRFYDYTQLAISDIKNKVKIKEDLQ